MKFLSWNVWGWGLCNSWTFHALFFLLQWHRLDVIYLMETKDELTRLDLKYVWFKWKFCKIFILNSNFLILLNCLKINQLLLIKYVWFKMNLKFIWNEFYLKFIWKWNEFLAEIKPNKARDNYIQHQHWPKYFHAYGHFMFFFKRIVFSFNFTIFSLFVFSILFAFFKSHNKL